MADTDGMQRINFHAPGGTWERLHELKAELPKVMRHLPERWNASEVMRMAMEAGILYWEGVLEERKASDAGDLDEEEVLT